jgi:hypothetical protein
VGELDKNGDAQLDAQELAAAPGLAAGARLIDADKNGQVTQAELENEFAKYAEQRVGLRMAYFRLTYNGKPVRDAEVTFLPESFLSGTVQPAKGTTDGDGVVPPKTEGQDLLLIQLGCYRVQDAPPQVKVPDKYTRPESPLGAVVTLAENESSYGARAISQLKMGD